MKIELQVFVKGDYEGLTPNDIFLSRIQWFVGGDRWISFHPPKFNSVETCSGLDVHLTVCSTYHPRKCGILLRFPVCL